MSSKYILPKGVQVIECKEIILPAKVTIEIAKWEDFIYILGGCVTIYKLGKRYYLLGDHIIFFEAK